MSVIRSVEALEQTRAEIQVAIQDDLPRNPDAALGMEHPIARLLLQQAIQQIELAEKLMPDLLE